MTRRLARLALDELRDIAKDQAVDQGRLEGTMQDIVVLPDGRRSEALAAISGPPLQALRAHLRVVAFQVGGLEFLEPNPPSVGVR
jgi:hypothetical protein